MKKLSYIIGLLVIAASLLFSACNNEAPATSPEALAFNEDGKFKIIQFTDMHYRSGDTASLRGIKLVNEALDAEKPDLVVFTGDIVWGKPAKEALDAVLAPVIERKIPWAMVFGNHDDESDMSRQQLIDTLVQMPYCLSSAGDDNVKGVGNFIIELKDHDKTKVKSVLYFFDSGSYSPVKGIGTYNWLDFSQVNWYRQKSAMYANSKDGKPVSALAFLHIPLPEYHTMATAEKVTLYGERRENECNGVLNTGLYTAMRESGDVIGIFAGHDHDNDYIGSYYDIALAYGRYSGGNTVYNNLGKNGCRVIELWDSKPFFTTYIYLSGGEIINQVAYPLSFEE